MDTLNPQQKEAVETTEGPVLVLAGAGSGKTRVLTFRVAYLIDKGLARGDNILAVTFTNKAAAEMKERIMKLVGGRAVLPWVGTFHSICLRILKAHAEHLGFSETFSIYDTSDQLSLVKEILKSLNYSTKKINPRSILGQISAAKSELITPRSYLMDVHSGFQEVTAKVYPKYQEQLKDNNAMDFDDLIMKTVQLFENVPPVLEKYQELFKYILIDEYQDTNHAQYKFSKLLAAKYKNICVVGDDAQSIYSFRGATIENILNFEKDYPDAKVIKLEQNYRSTKKILDASNHIITLNQNQKRKELWTENEEGDALLVYEADDEKDEGRWIANQIRELVADGADHEEIAILYRTNAQSRNLEEQLIRANVPYRIVGNVKFYDRREIKDVLAYLRVLYNPEDDVSLRRIINVPRRGVGPKTYTDFKAWAKAEGKSAGTAILEAEPADIKSQAKGIFEFYLVITELDKLKETIPVHDLITEIIKKTGYFEMLNDGTEENESRIENIKELVSLAKTFSDYPGSEGLTKFLEEVSLIEDKYKAEDENTPKVTLMTIHAAKGLEFDYVFLCGMEEGIFPHSRTYVDPHEMEEERRLAYVAITRAKRNLYMTHAETRLYFGQSNSNLVSRFITDIPEQLLDYASFGRGSGGGFGSDWQEVGDEDLFLAGQRFEKGDKVKHAIFGTGVIIDAADALVLVKFSGGIKELSLEYTNLEKLS